MIDLESASVAPFRIVVLSRDDVARGPATRYILTAHLRLAEADVGATTTCAGTAARPGSRLDPLTSQAMLHLGAADGAEELGLHAAHRVSERRLEQADLVLAVGHEERRLAVELRPAVRHRAFTLVEFARLLKAMDDLEPDPRRLVRRAAGIRGEVRPVHPTEDDLADLSRARVEDHERVLRRIDHAAADIGRGLARALAAVSPVHW